LAAFKQGEFSDVPYSEEEMGVVWKARRRLLYHKKDLKGSDGHIKSKLLL